MDSNPLSSAPLRLEFPAGRSAESASTTRPFALRFARQIPPETAIILGPLGDFLEWRRLEPVGAPLRLAAARDETGALDDSGAVLTSAR